MKSFLEGRSFPLAFSKYSGLQETEPATAPWVLWLGEFRGAGPRTVAALEPARVQAAYGLAAAGADGLAALAAALRFEPAHDRRANPQARSLRSCEGRPELRGSA